MPSATNFTYNGYQNAGGTQWTYGGYPLDRLRAKEGNAAGNYTGGVSGGLYGTDCGFAIPTGATIDGIVFDMACYGDGGPYDHTVRLTKTAGTAVGDNKALGSGSRWDTGGTWPYRSYGSSSDLWGTTWTVAEINASGFGAIIYYQGGGFGFVDAFRLTVYYTEASSGGFVPPRRSSMRTLKRM